MTLLAAKLADPATAAAPSVAGLLVMTAISTTLLRNVFTVPANGMVMVRIGGGTIVGSATPPSLLLGVLEGTTVRGRCAPQVTHHSALGTTTHTVPDAMFPVTSLTPGASLTWDAAYSVEVAGAGASWRYGGPNDATTQTAGGGIYFEVWSTT